MDLSNAAVQAAIATVADLGSETRCYAKTESKAGPATICLIDKGTSSLAELVAKLRGLPGDDIYYGYVRLVMNDATSVSTKFLFATYVGGSVSPIKRARVSVHKTALNWEVFSEKLEELDENAIVTNFTKTAGYGGWALASKSAREANAAGTLRRKPKGPAHVNVEAAVAEEKRLQVQDAVRKEEARKKSGKRLDILKQQKATTTQPAPSAALPAATASTTLLSPQKSPSGVSAFLQRAEAEEKLRQANQKRQEEEAAKRKLDSATGRKPDSPETTKTQEDAKVKAASAEAEFKRVAAELAEKKRQEEDARRQSDTAAAAKKAAEDANAVAIAAAAAAKKAAEDAQQAAAAAQAARKAADEAAERRRADDARRAEQAGKRAEEAAKRAEDERRERKERESRERDERKEKERREKKDKERDDRKEKERRDKKDKERIDKDKSRSPAVATAHAPAVVEDHVTITPSKSSDSHSVASPPKSPSPAPRVRKIMGIGQGATQGHRPDMEDRHVALSSLPFDPDTAFVAVYDGHGGSPGAEYCKTVLHTNVTRDPHYRTDMHKAIVAGFLKTDAEFLDVCRAAELEAGCTANSVFVTPTRLIVANAGDCRCILSRGGKVHLLSRDHKPYDATEKKRIELAGYFVEDNRVDGRLAVSRAIGDIDFKQAKGKTAEQQAVTALPEIIDEEREDDDEFLVVACDGLWDVLENEGVLEFIATRFELMSIDQIAQELVDYAVEIGSMDNTTAVIVRFK